MPVAPTYPGVYIEEIPSGVRTIVGVATSITAFIGRAPRGPVDEASTIFNFGDFERKFGGLHVDYPMGYAMRDFYLNGGSQAIIVRLYKGSEGSNSKAILDANGLELEAASEGVWGNNLRARIDTEVSEEVAIRYGLVKADLFNLTVRDMATEVTETFLNVTIKDSPRRVDRVLEGESVLTRFSGGEPADSDMPTAHADPAADKTIWEDDNASSKVEDANKAVASEPLDADAYEGDQATKTGLYALEKADLFNLLCIPPDVRNEDTSKDVYAVALQYCVDRRAFLIIDSPAAWKNQDQLINDPAGKLNSDVGLSGTMARNAAIFYPRVRQADPNRDGQVDTFVPCGIMAGLMARTDAQRGVWKAPAGIDAALNGVRELEVSLTDDENGVLNQVGINCLRSFPIYGRIAWGSRTLRGADQAADEYKYIPVRRTALFLEETLFRGLKWVVFEPNDEPLWAQIRLNVGAFMQSLFRQGAFQGTTPREAYFVKCDSETTTQNDIDKGIVNIVVGFAPLKPAEFVIVKLQQIAGQLEV